MPDLMNTKTQIALKIVGMRGLPVHKTAFAQIEPTKSFTVIVVWLKTQVTRQLKQKPQMKVLQSLLLAVEPEKGGFQKGKRSEEHTSELQSRPHLVCRLLLEKKKISVDDLGVSYMEGGFRVAGGRAREGGL